MTLPIEELGGLPEGEIDLRILQARVDMGTMLDEKLGSVTTAVNSRMDKHETAVNGRLDKQDAAIAKVLEVVTRVDKKGDDWHTADLADREQRDDKLASVVTRVTKIEELLKLLRLYVMATRAFKVARSSVSYAVKEGKQFGIWIAAFCSTFIAVIQFIHTVYPEYVHPFLLHHHLISH